MAHMYKCVSCTTPISLAQDVFGGRCALCVINHSAGVVGAQLADMQCTPYPDGNPKSLQGAKKYSLRYLPLAANIAVNQALEDGAKKYGAANWRRRG